jgi:hypothetical protein
MSSDCPLWPEPNTCRFTPGGIACKHTPLREAQMAKEQRSTKEKRKPKKDAGDKKGAKK